MKQSLSYGKISWAYDDIQTDVSGRPTPLLQFSPVRVNGKLRYPSFSDKVSLSLLKIKTSSKIFYRDAYREWFTQDYMRDRELGEGRSFLRWLQKSHKSIDWRPQDFKLHDYFTDELAPKHALGDEMAQGLSFAIKPVEVGGRKVKLYLQDEAVLNLLNMPYGEDLDFIELVQEYVRLRFQWETWRAPAPPFLDWVKAQAKRPVFQRGQLGFALAA
jgi:hypothetical protein